MEVEGSSHKFIVPLHIRAYSYVWTRKFSLKISRDLGMSEKALEQVVTSQYFDPSHSFEDQNFKREEKNVMGQSTEMSPLVSMLFRTFLNPLKLLMEFFYILVCYFLNNYTDTH